MVEEDTELTTSEGYYPAKPEEGQVDNRWYERPQFTPLLGHLRNLPGSQSPVTPRQLLSLLVS